MTRRFALVQQVPPCPLCRLTIRVGHECVFVCERWRLLTAFTLGRSQTLAFRPLCVAVTPGPGFQHLAKWGNIEEVPRT